MNFIQFKLEIIVNTTKMSLLTKLFYSVKLKFVGIQSKTNECIFIRSHNI